MSFQTKSRFIGFTLIELVIVITILGILAAVAIPKFLNLSGDARTAALSGVAGALASASANNYAARSANSTLSGTSAVTLCTDVGPLLQGGLPSGYTITAGTTIPAGTTATCTLTGPTGSTTTFSATGVS